MLFVEHAERFFGLGFAVPGNSTYESDPIAASRVTTVDPRELHPKCVLERPWRLAAKGLRADRLRREVRKHQCQNVSHNWYNISSPFLFVKRVKSGGKTDGTETDSIRHTS